MKIVVCSKLDIAGNLALNRLLPHLIPRHEVHVILSDYVLQQERQNPTAAFLLARERDIPVERFFPWLDRKLPELSEANGQIIAYTTTRLAVEHGISIQLCGRPQSPATIELLRSLTPDLIIACRYDYIFPEKIFELPRLGAYGLHPGRLPAIQGLCGPFWAMQQGDCYSGCTLFRIDQGIDTGDVIDIGWNEIDYSRSLLWNFLHTYYAGIEVLLQHLPLLEAGVPLKGLPQDPIQRRYYSYPTETDFSAFLRGGKTLASDADYLEILSWYLPGGQKNALMTEVRRIISGEVQSSSPAER